MSNEDSFQYQAYGDDDANEVGSLSDYISKHLKNRSESQDSTDEKGPKKREEPIWQSEGFKPLNQESQFKQNGMILHHLDSQLTNSHMERYLPTASTRYHLARERISNELRSIYEALDHYRQFEGPEYQPKIKAFESRVKLLQHKLIDVDKKISKLNPFQSVYNALQRTFKSNPNEHPLKAKQEDFWAFIPNPNQKTRDKVIAINNELESLQQVLEEQLHDPCFTAEQLGRLINQYDANLKKAEKLTAYLRTHQSLGEKFNQKLAEWYRSIYQTKE